MKGILMFDNTNDLVYSRVDDELTSHLFELAVKDHLIEETCSDVSSGPHLSKDVIVQIFSPLIASYTVMHGQFGQSYQSIEMENGTVILFKRIENYVAICIGVANKGFSMLQKEMNMFLAFVKMLYGPSLYLVNDNSITNNGKTLQEILSNMMAEWYILQANCQMFLVEAVERLLLNPDIAALCVNLLQEVLVKARSSQTNGSFSHSFILVDHKLLALYSSRNAGQLPKKCVLLLLVLAKALRSTTVRNVFTASKHAARVSGKGSSADDAHTSSEFLHSSLVFLPSHGDDIVPYMIYFQKITSKITLVLLCEIVTKTSLANNLTFLVKNFDNIQNHPQSRFLLCSVDVLRSAFESVTSSLEKLKVTENPEQYAKILGIKWDQMTHFGLHEYLRKSAKTALKPSEHHLKKERSLLLDENKLSTNMEPYNVIEITYFPTMTLTQTLELATNPDNEAVFAEIKKLTLKRLKDCSAYLEAKAEQNITMSSYVAEFPGLIHFIYVDRNSDCMIAPSVVLTEGHLKGTASLKKKIWSMVNFGRKYVNGARSFLCTWQHEDLRYFHNIWFENADGKNIKPVKDVDLATLPEKEMISGDFFRILTERCFPDASYDYIFCYELFCVHLVTTSTSDVIEQSRRLAIKLWDFSGVHRVSLDLLS